MQMIEWFRLWFSSPYYDLLYKNRNQEEASKIIDTLVDFLKIPTKSFVLDAACGKGRHSVALASKGFDVTGIDICAPAIEAAKQFENDHLHFYLHDMRLPFYINYFNYAFNFFTSFGYFKTKREHDDAMRTIAQSLKTKGIIVIDYLNVLYTEANLKPDEIIDNDGVKFNIKRTVDDKYFYKQIDVTDSSNSVNESFTERVEKFSLADFEKMLSKQKLKIKNVFGDYDLHEFDEQTSPRMIIMAQKD